MPTQQNNAGAINSIVQRGLFQGRDLNSPISSNLQNGSASQVGETGTLARDDNGNLVAQCGIELLEDSVCGP